MKLYNNRFKMQPSRNNVLSREDNYKVCAILYGYLNESPGLLSKSSSYVDIDKIQKTYELNRFYGLTAPNLSSNSVGVSNSLLQDKRETTMNANNDTPVIHMTNHNMPRKGSLYNNMVKEINQVKEPLISNTNNHDENMIKMNYNSALLSNNNMLQRLTVNNINPLEQLPVSIAQETHIKVIRNNKKNKEIKEIKEIKEKISYLSKPKIVVKPIKSKKPTLPKIYTQDSDEENITDESDVDTVDLLSDQWSDSEGSD